MNRLLLLLLCFAIPWLCFAQTKPANNTVISPGAFSKLIKQDIRYAILGEQSATPGVRVNIGKENSIVITGPIHTKQGILTFSAQGGIRNGLLSIVEEGRLVEWLAGLNFHVIPVSHKNAYDIDEINGPVTRQLIENDLLELERMSDSLEVLGCFIYNYDYDVWQSLEPWRLDWFNGLMQRKDVRVIYKSWQVDHCQSCLYSTTKSDIAAYYLKELANFTPTTAPVVWPLPSKWVDEQKLVDEFQLLAGKVADIVKLRQNREISIAEQRKAYKARQFRWWTFSAAGGGKNFSYARQSDSLTIDITRFTPAATVWRNWYRSTPRTYKLFRVGPTFRMDFVPTTTSTVSYTATFTRGTDGTKRVAEKSEGKQHYIDRAHLTGRLEAAAEGYLITKSRSAFGVFGQVRYRYTPLLKYSEFQVDAGPTFNVPSPVKSRSVLTLLVFASLSNVLPTYRNPLQHEGNTPLHERWFAGIRVGIPINIINEDN